MAELTRTFAIDPMQFLPLMAVLLIASLSDLRDRRIPNVLTLPAMAGGVALNVAMHGWNGLILALSGMALGAVLFLVPVALGGRGAGDLKLVAAVGAIGGPLLVFWAVLFAGIFGAIIALFMLRTQVPQAVPAANGAEGRVTTFRRRMRGVTIPYGPAIALGVLAAMGQVRL